MKTKGFTLVELLVVIAILAILATVSVVGYTTYINNANVAAAKQELGQIRDAALAFDITSGNKDGKIDSTEVVIPEDMKDTCALSSDGLVVTYTTGTGTNAKVIAYLTLSDGKVSEGTYPASGSTGTGTGSGQ